MPTIKTYQKQREREKIAYNYFINQGYSPEASAGIVGNLVYESGLNTLAEGDIGYKGGSSLGIAQFRGKRLQDLKKRYGNKWTDFDNQLDFVRHELETTHAKAGNILKNTNDVYKAGQVFSDLYEVPAKKYNQNVDRQKKVNNAYVSLAGGRSPKIVSKNPTPISDQAIRSYYDSIPTNDVKELDIVEETTNFTPEEEEETIEKDKDVEEVKQQTKEFNFLEEYKNIVNNQIAEQPTQQEQQIQQVPQQNLEDIYNQVSEFVDTPLAQQGGQYYNLPQNTATPITPEQFTLDYLNSAKYKQRIENSGYDNPDEVISNRLNNIKTVNTVNQNGKPSVVEQMWMKVTGEPYSTVGSAYDLEKHTIIMDSADKTKKTLKGTPLDVIKAHELGHAELRGTGLNIKDEDEIFNRQKEYKIDAFLSEKERDKIKTTGRKTDFSNIAHDLRPEENKSDLNGLRYLLKQNGIYDAGKEVFTKEHLKKLKPNFFKERLLKNYKEEDLIWLMNNIAKKEDEGSINSQIAQQGGVIKEDNLGQYKFPGEITQINSPNITMKNIPYNILGVADTGEQIMMRPNQNYYFKGATTVTEYPQITENEKEFLKYISKLK